MSASGMYETSTEGFGMDMVNFIEQVPTDSDMIMDYFWEQENEVAHQAAQDEVNVENTLQNPETEIRDLVSLDIREKITESDEKKAKTLVSWLKEKANKFLEK